MPFGKDYEKMVLIEIKHCIDRAEYKVVFIALMILNIASYILCVKNDIGKSYQFIRSANENFVLQGTEAAYIPYIMYLLLPVYATIIASLSLIREEKAIVQSYLFKESGKEIFSRKIIWHSDCNLFDNNNTNAHKFIIMPLDISNTWI